MLLNVFKLNTYLLAFFIILISGVTPLKKTCASELNEIDIEEREGKLNPSQTKVTIYNFGISSLENQQHVWYVSQRYLSLAKDWNIKDPLPSNFVRAIGASFTWVTLIHPSESHEFEPVIHRLIEKGLMSIDNLWIEGLPETKMKIVEQGCMQIVDCGPLQFKGRMLSAFKGEILFIGGKHTAIFPADNYYILDCDINQIPDVVGNANNLSHIQQFPNKRFTSVIFDHIGHVILLNEDLLKEYSRILKPGGTIQFKTEHADKKYTRSILKKNMSLMNANMMSAGFKNIKIIRNKDTENEEYRDFPWFILAIANT